MKKMSILLLEDQMTDADIVLDTLKRSGMDFNAMVVSSKENFIQHIQNYDFDVILADNSLPQFNAQQALQLIKSHNLHIPFILVTGTVSEEFAVAMMKEGVSDYILKDRLQRLPNAIISAIDKFTLEIERQKYLDSVVRNQILMKEAEQLAHFGSWEFEVANNLHNWSDEQYRILGYEPGEIIPTIDNFLDRIHPDDLPAVKGIFNDQHGQTHKEHFECRVISKDSTIKFIYSELIVTRDDNGVATRMHGFINDITEKKQAEEKMLSATRLYAFLSQINQTIVHSKDEQTVFKEACRIAIEYGKFKAAWIGMVDIANQKVNLVEGLGIPPEDLVKFTEVPYEINGPLDYVIRTDTYYVCNDIQKDLELERLKPYAAMRGFGSCMVLPIRKSGRIFGAFNLYATETDFFNSAEIALLEEAAGDISFSLGVFEKAKEKLRIDEKLKHKELRLRQAQSVAHFGSWELSFSTGIAIWSDEALRIYGIPIENPEQTFESWISFIHPEDLQYVLHVTKESQATLSNSSFFHRIVRKDGAIRHIYAQTNFEFDDKGNPIGLYGVAHDISDLNDAVASLRQSQDNLRLIVDLVPQLIFVKDYNGKFLFVNKSFAELYGVTAEKLIGKTLEEVFPKVNEPIALLKQDQEVIDNGELSIIPEMKLLDYTGSERIFYTTKVPYTLPGKNERAVLGIARDITEQKLAEEERVKIIADIVQRNKNLEQFSYIVSHNLRAPVANIIGLTDLLQIVKQSKKEEEIMMRELAISVKKLDDVIKDLNYVLQIKHQVNENRELVKFSTLISDIQLSINNLLRNEDAKIVSDFTVIDEMFTLKSYMYSIFFNLISNSIKYRQPSLPPIIEITSTKDENNIYIFFKDNGLGIDLNQKGEQVFGLYKRFHDHTEGKGMGLYMVKTQVETLGGKITIESEVNKGSTFRIVFQN